MCVHIYRMCVHVYPMCEMCVYVYLMCVYHAYMCTRISYVGAHISHVCARISHIEMSRKHPDSDNTGEPSKKFLKVDEYELDENELERMQRLLGFSEFATSKGKDHSGSDSWAVVGAHTRTK